MKLIAIILAAVLAASFLPMTAFAQTPIFQVEQQIKVTYKNGSQQVVTDVAEFEKLSLVAGTKEIDYFEFRTLIQSDAAFSLKTISGLNPTVRVLKADGNYGSISTSGADWAATKYLGASNIWQVYYLKVSASTIDTTIGQRTADFNSNLRFATHSGSSYITITMTDGASYQALWAIASIDIKALKSGVISEPNPDGGSNTDAPTGKVYYLVTIKLPDGQQRFLTDSKAGAITPFDVAVVGQGEPIESITYEMRMYLDSDVYKLSNSLLFDDGGATNNYGVKVDGKGLANEHSDVISDIAGQNIYRLLKIKVLGSEIEKNIQTEIANDGKLVYKSGVIEFFAKPSFVKLTSPSTTFTVNIPEQSVKYNLLSSTVSGGSTCSIEGDSCVNNDVDVAMNQTMIIAGMGIVGAGAAFVVMKGKRRR